MPSELTSLASLMMSHNKSESEISRSKIILVEFGQGSQVDCLYPQLCFSKNGRNRLAPDLPSHPRCENTVLDTSHTYRIFLRWMRSISTLAPILHRYRFSATFSHTLRGCFFDRFQIFSPNGFEESCAKAKLVNY